MVRLTSCEIFWKYNQAFVRAIPRYQPRYRRSVEDIANIRLLAPSGERVSLAQLSKITLDDGASTIYREGSQRYIASLTMSAVSSSF